MSQKYEIRIGKYLQEAWNDFLKAPEIYIVLTLVYFVCQFALQKIPFAGTIISMLVSTLFMPAVFVIADKTRKSGKASFEDLKVLVDPIPQLIVAGLLAGAITFLGFLVLILPGIYFVVSYVFTSQFILFRGLTFWPALEASRKLVGRSWFPVFGLCIVAFCVGFAGMLFLGVGLLLSAPLAVLMIHSAFRDIQSQVDTEPQVI